VFAIVAKRSPSVGDRHDRGVATAIVRLLSVVSTKAITRADAWVSAQLRRASAQRETHACDEPGVAGQVSDTTHFGRLSAEMRFDRQ